MNTAPAGVVDGMPEVEYHAHPALSSSDARRLLPPSCPAKFRWEKDHGRPEKREFDFGHAAHGEVLGVGSEVVVVDTDSWRTKAAKEQRDAAYAAGQVPLLADEWAVVQAMAAALRAHPIASVLFDPERGGKPEQSLFWRDERFGIERRCRLDWMPDPLADGRLIVPDYKSAVSSLPAAFAKSAANYGYDQQADFYTDGVRALGLAEDVAFVFVVQEKTAPYLVTVCELDSEALRRGRLLNERAMEVFVDCTENDTWPGYSTDVELVSLPRWATYDLLETA